MYALRFDIAGKYDSLPRVDVCANFTPTSQQNNKRYDKSNYTGVCVRVLFRWFSLLGWFWGCPCGFVLGHHRWGNKNLLALRVRKGHPTPPAYAMQSRQQFCIF
tara:strand:- start:732 stop:1043 length:312 start_codon:yes stop_codon:yes gene_type:complete